MSYSTVPCYEIDNTASTSLSSEGSIASVTLGCTWANRIPLQQDLYGNRRVFPGFAGSGAPRVLAVNNVVGFGERSERAGTNGQVFDYKEARMDVEYGPLQADPPGGGEDPGYDLVVESFTTNTESLRLHHETFRWGSSQGTELSPGEAPARQLRRITLVREYIGWQAIPTSILTSIGKVNNAPYTSNLLGLTFGVGTLLFGEPSARRTIRTNGNAGWNVTLSFQFISEGWNNFWRFESESYETLYYLQFTGNKEYKNYPEADFSELFQ